MVDLSIISLNVNGLRDQKKRWLLFNFLHRSKFDLVLLQETHVSSVHDCILWNRESGYKGYWSLGSSCGCGVSVLAREGLACQNVSFRYDGAGRIVLLDFTYNHKDLRVISVYVPTDGSERIAFLQTLDRYVVTRRQLIFGGDFNCLLDLARDKWGGNATLGGTGASHLTSLFTRHHLVDI